MRRLPLAAAVAATLIASAATAREGMWVPQQLPEIAGPLKEAGLELSPEQLANLTGDPMGAVVALGGCTASFVSPNGLVATNHHCAYGAIQLNSTPEKNLMATGFNAATPADLRAALAAYASVPSTSAPTIVAVVMAALTLYIVMVSLCAGGVLAQAIHDSICLAPTVAV